MVVFCFFVCLLLYICVFGHIYPDLKPRGEVIGCAAEGILHLSGSKITKLFSPKQNILHPKIKKSIFQVQIFRKIRAKTTLVYKSLLFSGLLFTIEFLFKRADFELETLYLGIALLDVGTQIIDAFIQAQDLVAHRFIRGTFSARGLGEIA